MTKITFKRAKEIGGYKVFMHFAPVSSDPVQIGFVFHNPEGKGWVSVGLMGTFETRYEVGRALVATYFAPLIKQAQAGCRKRGDLRRPKRTLLPNVAEDIYDMLVNVLQAPNGYGDHASFRHDQTSKDPAYEWRFQGCLGFGGKFYNEEDGFRVTCYPEDETPENQWLMALAQQQLDRIFISLTNAGQ
jgi:hypothetical protein